MTSTARNLPSIVEQGTSGIWTYRKWSDGTTEAWASYSGSSVAGNAWTSPIYYYDFNITIPSGLFASRPNVALASNINNQWWIAMANATTSTNIGMRICKPSSSAQPVQVNLYVIGKWK